jgi:hypothetical protein
MDMRRLREASDRARAQRPSAGPLAAFLAGLRARPELSKVIGVESAVMLPVPSADDGWSFVTVVGLRHGQAGPWSPPRFRLRWSWPNPEKVEVERLDASGPVEPPTAPPTERVQLLSALERLAATDPATAPDLDPLLERLEATWPAQWWAAR